jgi:hypothetical protein
MEEIAVEVKRREAAAERRNRTSEGISARTRVGDGLRRAAGLDRAARAGSPLRRWRR